MSVCVCDRSLVNFSTPKIVAGVNCTRLYITSAVCRRKKCPFRGFPGAKSYKCHHSRIWGNSLDVVILEIVTKKKQVHGQTHRQHIHIHNLNSGKALPRGCKRNPESVCIQKKIIKVCRISAQRLTAVVESSLVFFYTYILNQNERSKRYRRKAK